MLIFTKSQITWFSIITISLIILISYGFYEKNRKENLYKNFKANKKLICGDTIVRKSAGWKIRNNRFFTNEKIMKTIVFCKSAD